MDVVLDAALQSSRRGPSGGWAPPGGDGDGDGEVDGVLNPGLSFSRRATITPHNGTFGNSAKDQT